MKATTSVSKLKSEALLCGRRWESRREVQVRRWWGRRRRGKVVAEQCVVCEAAASLPSQMSRGHLGTGTP